MTLRLLRIGLLLGTLFVPATAAAYFTPEEVLFGNEFVEPPNQRDTELRVTDQTERSRLRREAEQERLFGSQHPAAPEELPLPPPEEPSDNAQGAGNLTPEQAQLLETLQLLETSDQRLLQRIRDRQLALQIASATGLHGGAPKQPPLAPTGAGGILTVIVMLSAVAWTLRRAWRAERATMA